jgi:hypothetical protein
MGSGSLTLDAPFPRQELDISRNKFPSLPAPVLAMGHLARLRCGGNPIPFSLPPDWIEDDVPGFLSRYVLETTGKRIAAMWSAAQTAEAFRAWANLVAEIRLERAEQPHRASFSRGRATPERATPERRTPERAARGRTGARSPSRSRSPGAVPFRVRS